MSLFCEIGSEQSDLSVVDLKEGLFHALRALGRRDRVLAIPPDMSRFHSGAGDLAKSAYEFYSERLSAILPALGTHAPMTPGEIAKMFGGIPFELFHAHNWRKDAVTLGEVPAEYVHEQSEGKVNYTWPVQINRMLVEGGFDLILSIGQVVPHEVIGMANYNKNILVGMGGPDSINRSHFLGAVYGMERIMGRADNPVRRVLNYASSHFIQHLPIVYVLTVVGRNEDGRFAIRGVFIGDDDECFQKASQLSLKVNFFMLEAPIRKAVVYLDPEELKSTWLGNKAIYRTRMALADGAELIVLAPGVKSFGEDATIDRLIRKHGYCGTPATLRAVENDQELADNLGAAAHLIHGSSEGRFTITYCPGGLSRKEICTAGFDYGDLESMAKKYDFRKLKYGYNQVEGEEIFFVPNPGLGLWAYRGRFDV
ncbi:MAG: D-mannonate epimerase [Acidobacteria bacterium]|nr:MAG: D-mannonate epimerase [Acidobacteria bacterium 13_1_40CM_4_58_4]PYT64527.1 MAG: D-mannonate epimerase [Acidobacteriota bacterium]